MDTPRPPPRTNWTRCVPLAGAAADEAWGDLALRHAAFVLATVLAPDTRDVEDAAGEGPPSLARFGQRRREAPCAAAARLWARCAGAALATQRTGARHALARLKAVVGSLASLLEQVPPPPPSY